MKYSLCINALEFDPAPHEVDHDGNIDTDGLGADALAALVRASLVTMTPGDVFDVTITADF